MRLIAGLVIGVCFATNIASAGMISSFVFEGRVTRFVDADRTFPGIQVGDLVRGSFKYSLDSSAWGALNVNEYNYYSRQASNPDLSVWDAMVALTTSTGQVITNKDNLEPLGLYTLQTHDGIDDASWGSAGWDFFALSVYHGNIFADPRVPIITTMGLNFNDENGKLFSGTDPPKDLHWENRQQSMGYLIFEYHDGVRSSYGGDNFIEYEVTAISAVPEPSSIILWTIGFVGIAFRCRTCRSPSAGLSLNPSAVA